MRNTVIHCLCVSGPRNIFISKIFTWTRHALYLNETQDFSFLKENRRIFCQFSSFSVFFLHSIEEEMSPIATARLGQVVSMNFSIFMSKTIDADFAEIGDYQ